MDEVEQEMKAQQHKEMVQKFFKHMNQMVHNTTMLAKEINESQALAPVLRELFLSMLIEIFWLLRDGMQVLEMIQEVAHTSMKKEKEENPDAAWLEEQLGDTHDDED